MQFRLKKLAAKRTEKCCSMRSVNKNSTGTFLQLARTCGYTILVVLNLFRFQIVEEMTAEAAAAQLSFVLMVTYTPAEN